MITKIKRFYKIMKIKCKKRNIYFMKGSNISSTTIFEGGNKIGRNSWLDGCIGYGSYIGNNCTISAKIGRYSSIADNVVILTGTHPTSEFVSTCPSFYSTGKQNGISYVKENKFKEKIFFDEANKYGCEIGSDVWIGYGAKIMGGCRIGDGAVIGAGALVTKDVAPYSIVVGTPAKIIRKRFTDDQIDWLLHFKWWNKNNEWIKENAEKFNNIEEFIRYNEKNKGEEKW